MYTYLTFNFLFFYLGVRLWSDEIINKSQGYTWVETYAFWKILCLTLFWWIVVPGFLGFKLLDMVFGKLISKIKRCENTQSL
jgi:hypothetical protein